MTQITMLARIRQILRETTAGYWSDAELYNYMDSGQNRVIQVGIGYQKGYKLRDPDYECSFLIPLITLDPLNTTTTGASYQEYNLPADYIETYNATYTNTTGALYPCALAGFNEAIKKTSNTYASASTRTPFYYIKAEKIGFFPQPSSAGANKYAHYYYRQPTVVAAGQDFILREETHESIMEYALYLAYQQSGDGQLSGAHLQNFQEQINKIL